MKKTNISKNIIIAIIIIIITICLVLGSSALRKSNSSNSDSWLNDSVATVDKVISTPIRWVTQTTQTIQELFNTYDENKELKQKIDSYLSLEAENKSYKDENEMLKEQLKMTKTLTNYEIVNSAVIDRSPDTWNNFLIIDVGAENGVEKGMPVMGNQGLIGRVVQANDKTSKVQLLTATTDDTSQFPVMVQTSDKESAYGLLKRYSKEKNAYVVTITDTKDDKKQEIKAGDKVITSGLGGESPKGLYVGKVINVKRDNYGLNQEVYVQPANNLSDISVVTVIKRLAKESSED